MKLEVGQKAPEFELPDQDEKIYKNFPIITDRETKYVRKTL